MTVVICENFLTTTEVDELLHFARGFAGWDTTVEGTWNRRFVHVGLLDNLVSRGRCRDPQASAH